MHRCDPAPYRQKREKIVTLQGRQDRKNGSCELRLGSLAQLHLVDPGSAFSIVQAQGKTAAGRQLLYLLEQTHNCKHDVLELQG